MNTGGQGQTRGMDSDKNTNTMQDSREGMRWRVTATGVIRDSDRHTHRDSREVSAPLPLFVGQCDRKAVGMSERVNEVGLVVVAP